MKCARVLFMNPSFIFVYCFSVLFTEFYHSYIFYAVNMELLIYVGVKGIY